MCHGDIKCENALVTSWNWLYLADFASYKPTYLPVNNPVSVGSVLAAHATHVASRCLPLTGFHSKAMHACACDRRTFLSTSTRAAGGAATLRRSASMRLVPATLHSLQRSPCALRW